MVTGEPIRLGNCFLASLPALAITIIRPGIKRPSVLASNRINHDYRQQSGRNSRNSFHESSPSLRMDDGMKTRVQLNLKALLVYAPARLAQALALSSMRGRIRRTPTPPIADDGRSAAGRQQHRQAAGGC